MTERSASLDVGVVLRRAPGATRWAHWCWRAAALLPGAPPADWRELRREGDAVEYHAATLPLELHRAETEGYLVALNMARPTVFVVLRREDGAAPGREVAPFKLTASAYEAQDLQDGGDEIVEPVPAPPALAEWIREFCARHHVETPFVKRRRGERDARPDGDGLGDPRVRDGDEVWRAPAALRPAGRG